MLTHSNCIMGNQFEACAVLDGPAVCVNMNACHNLTTDEID